MSVSRETQNVPLTRDEFTQMLSVSRETEEKLQLYADLLVKWQSRINLVGPATIPDLWRRHFLDSAQMAAYLPDGPILDLGSGAGFPGVVVALMGKGPVHLVESDSRKCAFLREAIRITGANAVVHNQRIEAVAPFPVVAVTARALASLEKLLEMAEKFLSPEAKCLFLKGRNCEDELTQAGKEWIMQVDQFASLSDPSGIILQLSGVHRGRD